MKQFNLSTNQHDRIAFDQYVQVIAGEFAVAAPQEWIEVTDAHECAVESWKSYRDEIAKSVDDIEEAEARFIDMWERVIKSAVIRE